LGKETGSAREKEKKLILKQGFKSSNCCYRQTLVSISARCCDDVGGTKPGQLRGKTREKKNLGPRVASKKR